MCHILSRKRTIDPNSIDINGQRLNITPASLFLILQQIFPICLECCIYRRIIKIICFITLLVANPQITKVEHKQSAIVTICNKIITCCRRAKTVSAGQTQKGKQRISPFNIGCRPIIGYTGIFLFKLFSRTKYRSSAYHPNRGWALKL